MFGLTTTHLRFVCEATTPLMLEAETFRAGSNLRGVLGQVMLRSYCAGNREDAQHADTCPTCWLLAAHEKPGEERRGYALVPPFEGGRECLEAGDSFEFGLTLFGNTLQFLPYFILTVPEMGRMGVGPGRGKFELKRVWALNPLTGESEGLFGENGKLVRTPTLGMGHVGVVTNAESAMWNSQGRVDKAHYTMPDAKIEIAFLTPMRLIQNEQTVKVPEFAPLFTRLLERLDELNVQYGGGAKRERAEVEHLRALAGKVELREVHTRWVDVWSGSNRRGAASPMGGFVGSAIYAAAGQVWQDLLPWLLWGELVQVGKSTVKGNGVMRVRLIEK